MYRPAIEFAKQYYKDSDSLIVAEIGVSQAAHALEIIECFGSKLSAIYLIDHYQTCIGYEEDRSKDLKIAKERLNYFRPVSKIIVEKSCEASKDFLDYFFDLVYIDGGHEYDEVSLDCKSWWPKVKFGGMLAGHDWGNKSTPGVNQAVIEFAKENSLDINHGVLDWWIIKEEA